ncbi:unnamed protein product [Adineta steineri]|uniref:Carrier domain-containing protein n=1 Tax=Adineta steineri TaxID=433720 RepID=A0A813PCK2_9BILA|nr:unnamed protein product [Adineta steineri]
MLSSYYVLHQLFHMAERHPQKIAIILDAQTWTYSELIEQVERVVDYLHHLNIVKGQIIYQFVERSFEMVCGFLGIMCVDAVYCPLNPTDSPSRLISILEQIQSEYVLVHHTTYKQFPKDIVKHVILLEEILFPLSHIEDINELPYCIEQGPAFIICTSGTTGRPKAILHTHKSFAASNAAYIQWNADMYTIRDQVLQLSTCTWILQLSEIALPLVVGGSVVLLRPSGHLDMSYLSKILVNQQVTTLIIGPAIIRGLIDLFEISQQFDTFKFVHNLCVTGNYKILSLNVDVTIFYNNLAEAVNPQQWTKFIGYLNLSTIRINSQYGMSECNGVLGCRLSDVYNTSIPIGCPFSNVRCLLIDEHDNIINNTINPNKIGQLHIGGPTLFNCYLNDSQRTDDTLITIDNHTYLKTGDLARYNERGELVHAGRADFQIKIHGQRVETTEIEDTIMNWSRNKISGCLVTKSPQNEDLLVAYIVSHDLKLNIEEIRNHCSKHLRQYMIPFYMVVLDKFPLNSNGKIDRKQLPIPSSLSSEPINSVLIDDTPSSELEEKIHKLWCSVLQLNSISRHANCFALGGSSLSLIQFFNYYQFHFAPDMQLNVLDFFISPTIGDHAQLLLNCKTKTKIIWSPLHLTQGVASFAQNRLWMDEQVRFHESNNEQVSVFNELLIYKLTSLTSLSIDRLRHALKLIVTKHVILRTAVIFDEERLIQKILPISPEHYEIQITYVTNELNIKKIFYDEETNRSLFNLEQGKVFRCHLLLQSSDNDLKHNDIIIFNFHHIAIDGSSIQVFIDDLRQNLTTEELSCDDQECITYLDYSQYERLEDWSNARQYWNKVLTSFHTSINQQNYPVRTGKAKMTPSTSACYRCIIPTSRVKQLGLKDFSPNSAIEFWGDFDINKIVLAPCCAGEIVSFYCFYPASYNHQTEEGWNFSATPSMLIERFPDLDPDLLAIFEHCEDIKLWKLVIHEPYPYWVKGCVALLGDAAHPMLPDQSQGACMAIEDAAALGIIFSPKYWGNKIHTVEHALKMYEMLRKTRATRVQEASARARENLNERIGWSSQRNHSTQQNATTKLTIDEINAYDMEKHLDDLLN